MQTAPSDQLVGRVLDGRYRVLDRIARGGMSTVYSALDERLDRHVAVKVMSAALTTDPAFAGRFEREARISAQLSHPNIVAVFDQGTDAEGHTYLVMELVRGRTLRDVIRANTILTPAQAVSIMEPVLGALAAAHRASYVHKDVKPENILISDEGVVKVTDFGLARAIEADATNTRTGLMMGTVAYCSPEHISGDTTDARTDVYAAGVVLFELLTGTAPFSGDSALQVAYQHVHSDVPAPSSRIPSIPPALDEFVLRATNRHPAGRPVDAGAMLAELRNVRADLGLPQVALPTAYVDDLDQGVSAVTAPIHTLSPPAPSYRTALHQTVQAPPTRAATHAAAREDARVDTRPAGRADEPVEVGGRDAKRQAKRESRRASPYQAPEKRKRQRRRALLAFLIVMVVSFGAGYAGWWLTSGRFHTLPDVSGEQQSTAITDLQRSGYVVVSPVLQSFSETVPAGRVISTTPPEGTRHKSGTRVQLVVSKGPERFTVPNVSGTYDTIAQQLSTIPVKVVRSDVADPTGHTAAGEFIKISPAPGTLVKRNDTITVYMSTGPPPVVIPDVTGQTREDATKTLHDAGFKVTATEDWSDTVEAGKVISEDPAQNTQALKFSTVAIVVSKGPSATIPTDIVPGADPQQAKAELDALGFNTVVHKKGKGLFDFSGYVVDRVEPGPGTVVAKGSTVDLYVK